jgi:hypothetical protein
MAEGHSAEGTDNGAENSDVVVDEQAAVHLAYRPQPADTLVGLRVRARIKRIGLLPRGVFLALWAGQWLLAAVGRGSVDVVSTVLFLFVALVVWGYPRLQAASVQRIIGWQGEYRATVSPAGITCRSDHNTLVQKWSVFRGYRETAAMTYNKGRKQRFDLQVYSGGKWYSADSEYFPLGTDGKSAVRLGAPGQSGIKARMRSVYVNGSSGDTVNTTTYGSWKYLYFSN